jgi:hypothetical protein
LRSAGQSQPEMPWPDEHEMVTWVASRRARLGIGEKAETGAREARVTRAAKAAKATMVFIGEGLGGVGLKRGVGVLMRRRAGSLLKSNQRKRSAFIGWSSAAAQG